METNDYMKISTLEGLRAARKAVSEDIAACERMFADRIHEAAYAFSLKKLLLLVLKKLRTAISGTPFAKS